MDKLQKIAKALWRYKERMVFAILLCVLGYRVYELLSPPVLAEAAAEQKGAADPPEIAPNPPTPDPPGQVSTLHRRNPFSYYSDAKVDSSGVDPAELGLELLDIKEVGGKWRVRLKTPGANRKWYDEGESFEEFVLEEINAEEKTVVIYVERIAKTVTLRLR